MTDLQVKYWDLQSQNALRQAQTEKAKAEVDLTKASTGLTKVKGARETQDLLLKPIDTISKAISGIGGAVIKGISLLV